MSINPQILNQFANENKSLRKVQKSLTGKHDWIMFNPVQFSKLCVCEGFEDEIGKHHMVFHGGVDLQFENLVRAFATICSIAFDAKTGMRVSLGVKTESEDWNQTIMFAILEDAIKSGK